MNTRIRTVRTLSMAMCAAISFIACGQSFEGASNGELAQLNAMDSESRPEVLSATSSKTYSKSEWKLKHYEYSRALGYLWGDGGLATDGSLYFRKATSGISKHYASTAGSYFGDALETRGSKYYIDLPGIDSEDFLTNGPAWSSIKDKPAFVTSVIETEGAVLVGRIADDPKLKRCKFIRNFVNSLSSDCSWNTCSGPSCDVPNCAFIAHAKYRGRAHQEGKNCGVYLSGNSSDWQDLFKTDDFWFVQTGRVPGGEPPKRNPSSRPYYTD